MTVAKSPPSAGDYALTTFRTSPGDRSPRDSMSSYRDEEQSSWSGREGSSAKRPVSSNHADEFPDDEDEAQALLHGDRGGDSMRVRPTATAFPERWS